MRSHGSIGWRSTGARLALLAGLALALRLFYLYHASESPLFDTPVVDAGTYVEEALQLASGAWAGSSEPFWQPPLYPYFLGLLFALFGENYYLPRFVQAVAGAITCVSLYWLGRRTFSSPTAGWLAAGTAALYGPFIYFEGELLPVGLATCLNVVLLLTLLWAARGTGEVRWLLAGLLLACSGLLVANVFLFAPVVFLWALRFLPASPPDARSRPRRGGRGESPFDGEADQLLPRSRRGLLLQLAAFCLGIALVLAPVTLRNRIVGSEWVLVSYNAGVNFFIGNNPDYKHTVTIRPGREWVDLVNRPEREAGITGKSAGSRYFFSQSWSFVSSDPVGYFGLLLHKARLFWRGDEILRNLDPYYARTHSSLLRGLLWKYGLAFPFGVIAPLALLGLGVCLMGPLRRSPAGALVLLFTATYAFSVILFFVTGRYRLPVVPFLLLFAAHGLLTLFYQRGTRLALAGVLLLLLLFGTNRGVGAMNTEGDVYQHYLTGLAFQEKGMQANAQRQYRHAVKLDPAHEDALLGLGTMYAVRRRYDDAIEAYRQLLAYYPDRDDVRLRLADVFLKKAEYQQAIDFYQDLMPRRSEWAALHGRLAYAYLMSDAPAEAEAAYCRVLELKPDSLLVRYQLAQLYQVQGKDDQALAEYRILVEQQPDHVEGLCQLADLLLKRGHEAEAEHYLKTALAVDPQSVPALRSMGRFESGRGRYEAAIQHLSTVASLVPEDYMVHQELGRLYKRTGQQDRARAAFEHFERETRRHRMRQIAEEKTGKVVEEILGERDSRPRSPRDQ